MGENKIFILGVGVSKLSLNDILEEVEKYLKKVKSQKSKVKSEDIKPLVIFTPNPEIVVYAQRDEKFRKIVNSAQINIPDGQGLVWASQILGQPLRQRIAGVDLLEALVKLAAKKGLTIGLIGGRSHVAVKAAECLRNRCPGLRAVVFENVIIDRRGNELAGEKMLRYYDIKRQKEVILRAKSLNILISQYLNIASLDILFVGLGAPKQEYFIYHLSSIIYHPIIMMSVGGVFDYLSGAVPRAPKWLQNLGLEWFYRLIRQPWRIKRQLALAKFIFLAARG